MEKVYTNFTLFDGQAESNQTNAWLAVDTKSGRITARGTGTYHGDAEQVDLNSQYVMPGFIDVHTHITGDPAVDDHEHDTEVAAAIFAYGNLRQLLKSGVTFTRSCGVSYDTDIKLNQIRSKGWMEPIPNIMPSGLMFSMTGGHGDAENNCYLVDSPDEMRKSVRVALKKGAENIKMMATGGVTTPGDFMSDPQLSVEEMHTGVIEAHHKGKITSSHAEGNPGIQNAIDAGIDSIEHGFYVTEAEAKQMIAQGTYLTPTIVALWSIPEYGEGQMPDWEFKKAADAADDAYVNLKRAYELGVKFTLGTDAGTPMNGFNTAPVEMRLLTEKLGIAPIDAYKCSTINSAKLCKIDADYGTLEVGKFADFQVLRDDPLADVTACAQTDKQVYLHGERAF